MKFIQAIQHIDLILFDRLFAINVKYHLTLTARLISRLADGPLYVMIGLIFVYLQDWFWVKVIVISFAIERTLYFILKNGCKRNRPAQSIDDFESIITPSDKFSFPSGHTSAAFLMITILFFASQTLLAPLYVWAVCVGLSRVLLGVHFITDTIAGAALGSIIAALSIEILL